MNAHVIDLSDETEAWATARAEAEGFATLSDWVAFQVQRQKDAETLRAALTANDPVPLSEFDDAFFAELDRIADGAA